MKAVDFIAADTARAAKGRSLAIGLGLAVLSAGLGLWLRGDFVEVFTLRNLLPAALMLVALVASFALYSRNVPWAKKRLYFGALLAGILAVSLVQPQTPVSLSKFQDPERFWPENLHCLGIGVGVSSLISLLLSWLAWKSLPLPNRRWQRIFALLPGLGGLLALTLHCMGPLFSHTLIAHWGQVAIVLPLAYLQQRLLFRRQMEKVLGGSSKSLKRIADLDDL